MKTAEPSCWPAPPRRQLPVAFADAPRARRRGAWRSGGGRRLLHQLPSCAPRRPTLRFYDDLLKGKIVLITSCNFMLQPR